MPNFLYRQIQQYILSLLREHKGETEFMLPSENRLAMQFGASRVSVRKALAALEEDKLVYRVQGKGTFAREPEKLLAGEGDKEMFAFISPDTRSKFNYELLRGVHEFCIRQNIRLISMCSFDSVIAEANAITAADELHCSGIIIMPIDRDSYSDELLKLSINKKNAVFVDRKLPGLPISCVSSDHFNITYDAIRYLHGKGHNKIAYINSTEKPSSAMQRIAGYEKGLLDFFGHIDKYYILAELPSHKEQIKDFTIYFKNNPDVTGIISGSGVIADALIAAMKNLGKQLKDDYDIVLIDDESSYIEDITGQKFATISQNGELIGKTAAQTLYSQLHGGPFRPADILIPVRFLHG